MWLLLCETSSVGSSITREAGLVGLRHTLRGGHHMRLNLVSPQQNAETEFVIDPVISFDAARSGA
jgi:hypothetical protein